MRITQAEARRLRRRVKELEGLERQRNNLYASEWPGVHLGEYEVGQGLTSAIRTARRLNHAVCAVLNNGKVQFYAVRL